MKFSSISLLALVFAPLAMASPVAEVSHFEKRATTSDVADFGYATLNGGTTGGKGGAVTTVTTLAALTTAVTGNTAGIVIISGTITGNTVVKVGSNKTILGKNSSAGLVGIGLRVIDVSNVIIRNLKISVVLADAGDAIGIQAAKNVWIDHLDLSSNRDHDKDYYDGLLDITHGSAYVTVSWTILHDHWKSSLVGHSDSNASEDTSITVTYHHNYWYNLNSRLPSFRFGTGHVYNNYYLNSADGINTRVGAQLLVENNLFSGVSKPLYSTDGGFAVAKGNDFGGASNTAATGTFTTPPYKYTLDAVTAVKANVVAGAGQKLSF